MLSHSYTFVTKGLNNWSASHIFFQARLIKWQQEKDWRYRMDVRTNKLKSNNSLKSRKLKIQTTLKPGGDPRCLRRSSRSCFTCGTHYICKYSIFWIFRLSQTIFVYVWCCFNICNYFFDYSMYISVIIHWKIIDEDGFYK